MAVIYRGTFAGLAGAKGMGLSIGGVTGLSAQSFSKPFKETPAVFLTPTSDNLIQAASSSKTGFTATSCSASVSGTGASSNYIAVGRGTKNTFNRFLGSGWGFEYGSCTIGSAKTFTHSFDESPKVVLSPTSDEGVYLSAVSKSGFTPTAATGCAGTGTSCNYLAVGVSNDGRNNDLCGVGGGEKGGLWVEFGTATIGSAVSFYHPFKSTPTVLCGLTSDAAPLFTSGASTTGFTPTKGSCTGQGTGTSCTYIAFGERDL